MSGSVPTGPVSEPQLVAFVDALPKVELHVHLEGSVRPETLLELAAHHGVADVPRDLDAVRDWYAFRDFAHFVEVYFAVCDTLCDEVDFARIARETGEHLAEQGVRWAEVTFTPFNHLRRGLPFELMIDGIEEGRRQARAVTGVELRWSFDVPGQFGPEAAMLTLDHVERRPPDGLVSFGLGGPEVPRPAFAEAFARARSLGLHSVPHAGETTGPQAVWDSLVQLGAERIGHGVRSIEDPELITHLRDERVPLEICPTSNLCLGVVDSLEEHPLRRLIDAGVVVTLNSDDPPMFGTTLRDEYLAALGPLGLSPAQLRDLAVAGAESSFMPEPERRRLADEISCVPLPQA